jgi:hypothetical protein
MTIEDLYEQHGELKRLSKELLAIAGMQPIDLAQLTSLRRTLASRIAQHLADEARLAVTPMTRSADPEHRRLARRYTDDLFRHREVSSAHHSRWSALAIVEDPAGYRAAVRSMIQWLEQRATWEETEFLPAAARLAGKPLRRAG